MGTATAFAFNKGLRFATAGCPSKKAILKARYAAEEFVDTATLAIKKNPIKAICGTFGAAFAIGVMAGWVVKRG
jgi:hypothetical protein